MLLSQGSFLSEFSRFLLLMFWICLPVLLLAVLVTAYFHYRHRRKRKDETDHGTAGPVHLVLDDGDQNPSLSPEGFTPGYGQKPDQFRLRLRYSFVRSMALANDFELLHGKHQTIFSRIKKTSDTSKNENMEKIHLEVQQTLQEQIEQMQQHFDVEKSELRSQLEELNRQYETLVNENQLLHEQMAEAVPVNTDLNITPRENYEEEIKQLRNRVAETEYMEEIINEKKAQIDFLQNQLDQRIRAQHQAEQQLKEAHFNLTSLSNDNKTMKTRLGEMKNELDTKHQSALELQQLIAGKDDENRVLRESLQSGVEEITGMKAIISNFQHEQEALKISISEKDALLEVARDELKTSKEEISRINDMLTGNRQILHRFYTELSAVIGEKPDSRVIAMKPIPELVEHEAFSEPKGHHSDSR